MYALRHVGKFYKRLLGGSHVVISGVISPLIGVVTVVSVLLNPLKPFFQHGLG